MSKVSSNFSNDNNTRRLFTALFYIRILFYVDSSSSSFSSFIVATFINRLLPSNRQFVKHVASSSFFLPIHVYIHNDSQKEKRDSGQALFHCVITIVSLISFELRHPNKRQCTRLSIYVKVVWFGWLTGCMAIVCHGCCMVCVLVNPTYSLNYAKSRRYTVSLIYFISSSTTNL